MVQSVRIVTPEEEDAEEVARCSAYCVAIYNVLRKAYTLICTH